jgi:outer membrane biosynthesis protein TonB
MKRIVFWSSLAGAALLAACGQQESADNGAVNSAIESSPANMAAAVETENLAQANNLNAVEEATPEADAPAEERAPPPAAKARTEGARRASPEPPAAQPAPKQEPAPAPTSTCTPEHEAMGHCKQ